MTAPPEQWALTGRAEELRVIRQGISNTARGRASVMAISAETGWAGRIRQRVTGGMVNPTRPTAGTTSPRTLAELFEAQVAATPERDAVIFQDTVLSYARLNGRANRLSRLLVERHIGPERIVALALPRTPEWIIALPATDVSRVLLDDPAVLAELTGAIERAVRRERELLVDPDFFVALRHHNDDIAGVDLRTRRGRWHNEMSRYRYDVVLRRQPWVGQRAPGSLTRWGQVIVDLSALLSQQHPPRVRVVNVGNTRVAHAVFEAEPVAGLARRLDQNRHVRPPLTTLPRPKLVPPSSAQRRLWFLNRLEGPSATDNVPLAMRLRGDLDRRALELALADVVSRHESLQTVFPERAGVPHQQVLGDLRPELTVVHASECDLAQTVRAAGRSGFDLRTEIPFRAMLVVLAADHHVLLLTMHHIACDGWSLAPLWRDLATAYRARRAGSAPAWAPLPMQYIDYTLWQHQLLAETDDDGPVGGQLAFWTKTLAGLPEQVSVPTDRPRPAAAAYRGDVVHFELSPRLHAGLVQLAARSGTSLFMVLHAGLAALLTRLGAGEDVPIGTTIAGRTDAALENLVGLFVNTLVLRSDTSGDPSFTDLLARIRKLDLAAYAHQDLPFERLVEELKPARALSHHPLVQLMLVLDSAPKREFHLPGLSATAVPVHLGTCRFDLVISLSERDPQGMSGELEYDADLFDRDTALVIVARWIRVLAAVATDPDQRLSAINLLTASERDQLTAEWQRSSAPSRGTPFRRCSTRG
jgi:hypothetical protein